MDDETKLKTPKHESVKAPDLLAITEGEVAAFLELVGAPVHKNCPRCGSDNWNPDGNPSQIIMIMPVDEAETHNSTIRIGCGNCGFTEFYASAPVIQHFLKIKYENE